MGASRKFVAAVAILAIKRPDHLIHADTASRRRGRTDSRSAAA